MGCESTHEEWTKAVHEAFMNNQALVQEYHPSDKIELPFFDGTTVREQMCPFVLGQFVIDGCGHTGTSLRYTQPGHSSVINKHRGAAVGCIWFEGEV